jgi:Rps23 Pro-64 3,4-dihydroxylase Tpa1-like proline 4-hydroxylase
MSRKDTKQNSIMTVADLQQVLAKLTKEIDDDFLEIWLSCDEEGNEFLPMLRNAKFSLSIDKDEKRIIFFPSHR